MSGLHTGNDAPMPSLTPGAHAPIRTRGLASSAEMTERGTPRNGQKPLFGDSIPKCRTGSNLGNIELFNVGLKIGEPQFLDDWPLAATSTQTQSSCRVEATTLDSLVLTGIASGLGRGGDGGANRRVPAIIAMHWRTQIARHPASPSSRNEEKSC
jgi:hypothetical protein